MALCVYLLASSITSRSLANSALVRWYCSGSLSAVSRMSNTTALMSLGREDIWTDEGNNMGRQVVGQYGHKTVARLGLERSKGRLTRRDTPSFEEIYTHISIPSPCFHPLSHTDYPVASVTCSDESYTPH